MAASSWAYPLVCSVYAANLPADEAGRAGAVLPTGIYFGWAQVDSGQVFPMVMSFGWNPFFKNTRRSAVVAIDPGSTHYT